MQDSIKDIIQYKRSCRREQLRKTANQDIINSKRKNIGNVDLEIDSVLQKFNSIDLYSSPFNQVEQWLTNLWILSVIRMQEQIPFYKFTQITVQKLQQLIKLSYPNNQLPFELTFQSIMNIKQSALWIMVNYLSYRKQYLNKNFVQVLQKQITSNCRQYAALVVFALANIFPLKPKIDISLLQKYQKQNIQVIVQNSNLTQDNAFFLFNLLNNYPECKQNTVFCQSILSLARCQINVKVLIDCMQSITDGSFTYLKAVIETVFSKYDKISRNKKFYKALFKALLSMLQQNIQEGLQVIKRWQVLQRVGLLLKQGRVVDCGILFLRQMSQFVQCTGLFLSNLPLLLDLVFYCGSSNFGRMKQSMLCLSQVLINSVEPYQTSWLQRQIFEKMLEMLYDYQDVQLNIAIIDCMEKVIGGSQDRYWKVDKAIPKLLAMQFCKNQELSARTISFLQTHHNLISNPYSQ